MLGLLKDHEHKLGQSTMCNSKIMILFNLVLSLIFSLFETCIFGINKVEGKTNSVS